jgi:protease-4
MIGITSRSVVSGQNKDLANPLEPVDERHFVVLQGLVDTSYTRFRSLVAERRPTLTPADLDRATDGRIFTGEEAIKLGLIDALGGVREAHAAAKRRAGVESAQLVRYVGGGELARTPYATSSQPAADREINLLQLNLPQGGLPAASETSGIYYLWTP